MTFQWTSAIKGLRALAGFSENQRQVYYFRNITHNSVMVNFSPRYHAREMFDSIVQAENVLYQRRE